MNIKLYNKPLEELKEIFESNACEAAVDYCMQLTTAIVNCGSRGVSYLTKMLTSASEVRTRAILFSLSSDEKKQVKIIDTLILYIDDARPSVVSEAIDGLRFMEYSCWEIIKPKLEHSNEYVRGAALRYASKMLSNDEAYAILISALNDPHYIVRENALDELAGLGKREAVVYISKFLTDINPDVRQAARTALEELK